MEVKNQQEAGVSLSLKDNSVIKYIKVMSGEYFTREEMNIETEKTQLQFGHIDYKLNAILEQTTKHNCRLRKIETALLILGTAVVVLLIVNGSEFTEFISKVFI